LRVQMDDGSVEDFSKNLNPRVMEKDCKPRG
jgi:hypothetical protein